ncbi:hypothetical protein TPE_2698 [Treponema pedis str. T A4]|uniref:Uncharacterized protein n=1 Tax=Treponema pedis str. T A4 TaxID=1291379 RepID=S5ZXF3_9SPIR|nr:hypothetical protein TPE_2698 [Treponema pedis str. T A4]
MYGTGKNKKIKTGTPHVLAGGFSSLCIQGGKPARLEN